MSAVWPMARSAVRAHRGSLAGSALVVVLAAALLTATGVWIEAGARAGAGPAGPLLLTVASSFAGTAVLVVLLIAASTFAAALRHRARELALLRAVGATGRQVRQLVTAEVLLVFAVAAPFGVVPGLLLAPGLTGALTAAGVVPDGFAVALSPWPVVGTLALLLPTAVLAARSAGRASARTSPTAAMQRTTVEPAALGRGRTTTAAVLTVAGLLAAGVPFVVPGALGSATGAVSAILLLVAVALAGPVLVAGTARRALALPVLRRRPVATLALLNTRGFSRRLTSAVVPLALLLALGTVQSGFDVALGSAAEQQVRDGVAADVVVRAPAGLTGDELRAVEALPGVAATATTGTLPVEVRTDQDDEELPFLDALSWEPVALRTLAGDPGLLDPDVRSGTLDDLDGDRTVAVSTDTVLDGSARVGAPVEVRLADGDPVTLTVVAVYERGLGFGDYLVGDGSAGLAGTAPAADTAFLAVDGPAADVRAAVAALGSPGLTATDVPGYAAAVRDGAAAEQTLSGMLLAVLLAFVALAAANTLGMLVSTRRAELALLRRTGATRRQVLATVAAESVLTTVTAVVVGTACVLPALVGAGYGLLGRALPALDAAVYGALVLVVVLVGVAVPVLAAVRVTSAT
ncbi:FtsX-like permease family protein [Cellulomonas sp. Marseille-Q8402]